MYFYDYKNNISFSAPEDDNEREELRIKIIKQIRIIQRLRFANDIEKTKPAEIEMLIDRHLRFYLREGGEVNLFFDEMKQVKDQFINTRKLTSEQVDSFLLWYEKHVAKDWNYSENPNLRTSQTSAENDVTKIDYYLKDCKSAFLSEQDYLKAIQEIEYFFNTGKTKIKNPLFVKNGNIKKIAFAMGEIWRNRSNEVITFEYLRLYKKVFSIFGEHKIDKNNLYGCNLYKYSISKT